MTQTQQRHIIAAGFGGGVALPLILGPCSPTWNLILAAIGCLLGGYCGYKAAQQEDQ